MEILKKRDQIHLSSMTLKNLAIKQLWYKEFLHNRDILFFHNIINR